MSLSATKQDVNPSTFRSIGFPPKIKQEMKKHKCLVFSTRRRSLSACSVYTSHYGSRNQLDSRLSVDGFHVHFSEFSHLHYRHCILANMFMRFVTVEVVQKKHKIIPCIHSAQRLFLFMQMFIQVAHSLNRNICRNTRQK